MKNNMYAITIVIGSLLTGLGLGLFFGQPGFGLITGLGIGLLLWAVLSHFKK